MKVLIVYYSAYGHIHAMAKATAEGVAQIKGAVPQLRRVPETLPETLRKQIGIFEAQKAFEDIPLIDIEELATADAVIFGTPTRFGNMCGQMRQFLDGAGPLWQKGALIGKVGSVFTSSATQHGGQESTILSFHTTLLHLGFIVVGLPYSFQGQMRLDVAEQERIGRGPFSGEACRGNHFKVDSLRRCIPGLLHNEWRHAFRLLKKQ
jgi:NAD(P)H dehydrogenase (quinone)